MTWELQFLWPTAHWSHIVTLLAWPQASCTVEGKSLHMPGGLPGRDGK